MSNSRKVRGMATQRMVAAYWSEHERFPYASAGGAGAPGVDVFHVGDVAIEVKARRAFNPQEWMRQAQRNAGFSMPLVIMRPDGAGETSIGDWPAFFRHEDARKLIAMRDVLLSGVNCTCTPPATDVRHVTVWRCEHGSEWVWCSAGMDRFCWLQVVS